MTLNYMGRCKALNDAGEVGANSKPHLWPRRGCNCYNGARVPTCARFHLPYPSMCIYIYIYVCVCVCIYILYIYIYIYIYCLDSTWH